jgi:sugar/nucleoside kinase (ribokinase family)
VSEPYDLFVVGRPSVDVMFSGLPEWPALGKDIEVGGLGVCAGTSFNTPAAANRLGMRVAYVATVGNDDLSRIILREFESERLPTDLVEVEDRPLPALSVALNIDGDRGFVTYWGDGDAYDARLDARALKVAAQIDARHAHLYVDSAPELEVLAKRRGMTVSLDTFDGSSFSSARPLEDVLTNADVLFANETEAAAMVGADDLAGVLERLAGFCPCVVIKRGAAGATGIQDGVVVEVPAEPVEVVDTTGAGDCFNAGFLAGWLDGLDLRDALTLGVLCGSRAVADYGGYRGCPREAEFRTLAASRGIMLRQRGAT